MRLRNLHTKWQKHYMLMAELAANKDWLDKVDKVSEGMAAARRECPGPPPVSIPAAQQGRVPASSVSGLRDHGALGAKLSKVWRTMS